MVLLMMIVMIINIQPGDTDDDDDYVKMDGCWSQEDEITLPPSSSVMQDGNPKDVKIDPNVADKCKRKIWLIPTPNLHRRGTVLGMSCDAYSEVDNEVSWVEESKFIVTITIINWSQYQTWSAVLLS